MDITFLTNFAIPLIVGICLCLGYIIKNIVPNDNINRFIPLVMGIVGVLINVWVSRIFTAEIVLGGLFLSGLVQITPAFYEMFRNLIKNGD